MTLGEAIKEDRRSERQREFQEQVQREFESAWSSTVDREYSVTVHRALKLFFRLSDRTYAARKFVDRVEYTTEEFAALNDLILCFEEAAQQHGRVAVEKDGALVDPLGTLSDYPGLARDVWALFNECSTGAPATRRIEQALGVIEAVAVSEEIVTDPSEDTHTIGEDFEESPLYELWEGRQDDNRTIAVLIVARDGQTGVGKTTLAVQLCEIFDEDWSAAKATNRAWEYRELLRTEDKGSVLLADEFATMWDARRSMSTANVEASQDWQMLRKLQVSTVGTTPSMSAVDNRFLTYMDIQIVVTRRGHGRVYRLKEDDQDGSMYRQHICNVEWGAIDDSEAYQKIEEMKLEKLEARLAGDDEQGQEESEEIEAETRREVRNDIIRDLNESGMTQSEIAEYFDITQPTVSSIIREDS